MENCATREEFIAFMAEYGYKVRWEPNQKIHHLHHTGECPMQRQ